VNLNDTSAPFNHFVGEVRPEQRVDDGDLLVAWSASLDAYIWRGGSAVVNQHIFKVYERPEIVDRTYLWYALRNAMSEIRAQVHGATMKHITKPEFEAITIPVPGLDEQRRIASRLTWQLGTVDRITGATRAAHDEIDTLSEVLWLPAESQSEMARVRLKTISARIEYGWTASASARPEGPRFLRITDIQAGRVDWLRVPYSDSDPGASKLLRDGDVVVARTGGTTGKSYIITNPPRAVFASYLLRVTPARELDPLYLYSWMQSRDYWNQVSRSARGGAQPNLNAAQLGDFTIPLPPLTEQRRFAREWQERQALVERIRTATRRELEAIEDLRAALLRRAFNELAA
jgi:type I restriction enzyme S subunit